MILNYSVSNWWPSEVKYANLSIWVSGAPDSLKIYNYHNLGFLDKVNGNYSYRIWSDYSENYTVWANLTYYSKWQGNKAKDLSLIFYIN